MAKDSLTKDQMKQAIREGGSVLHKGRLLRTDAHIDRAFETEEDIDGQIAELEQRKAAKADKAKAADKEAPQEPEDLSALKKDDLLVKAAGLGLDVNPSMTKAEIIEAIQGGSK